MTIQFKLSENENKVTPIRIAEALISDPALDAKDLIELAGYLDIYWNHHAEE